MAEVQQRAPISVGPASLQSRHVDSNGSSQQQAATSEAQARIQELEQQVLALQVQLGELHATDLNSLRRAHRTLTQHIQALDIEVRHVLPLLNEFQTEFVTPEYIAKEIGVVSAAISSLWALDRTLRIIKLPMGGSLAQAIFLAAAGWVGIRLLRHSGSHLLAIMRRNRVTKQALIDDWQTARQRLDTMLQLIKSNNFSSGSNSSNNNFSAVS